MFNKGKQNVIMSKIGKGRYHHAGYHGSSQSMLSSYTKPTGAQLAQMAAILNGKEGDQFDELGLALKNRCV